MPGMLPLDTILFDMGGTLDGRGAWRGRSRQLFLDLGLSHFSDTEHRAAFDYAEAQAHKEGYLARARLRDMLRSHIGWQLESLGIRDEHFAREWVDRFAGGTELAAAANRVMLATLRERGFRLGIVSNACGNVATLCDEFGYSPSLSAIVDSYWFGRTKPDPAIFLHALELLGASPERTGFVGDSVDRDIRPAKQLAMTTFWIPDPGAEPESAADVVLDNVADLPECLQALEGIAPARPGC
jgi:HAD superfamily hydrolase (TIGR01509 family)